MSGNSSTIAALLAIHTPRHYRNVQAWYSSSVNELTITAFARLGGAARAKKLSRKRRLEISRKANRAKAAKRAHLTKA